jgi:hypothetical protein
VDPILDHFRYKCRLCGECIRQLAFSYPCSVLARKAGRRADFPTRVPEASSVAASYLKGWWIV